MLLCCSHSWGDKVRRWTNSHSSPKAALARVRLKWQDCYQDSTLSTKWEFQEETLMLLSVRMEVTFSMWCFAWSQLLQDLKEKKYTQGSLAHLVRQDEADACHSHSTNKALPRRACCSRHTAQPQPIHSLLDASLPRAQCYLGPGAYLFLASPAAGRSGYCAPELWLLVPPVLWVWVFPFCGNRWLCFQSFRFPTLPFAFPLTRLSLPSDPCESPLPWEPVFMNQRFPLNSQEHSIPGKP